MSFEDKYSFHEPRGMGAIYRRAIILALEQLNDLHRRSNIDAVRRNTQALLEEDEFTWNDVLFVKTFKSIVNAGDIELCANISAELSPIYKKKLVSKIVEEQQHQQKQNQISCLNPAIMVPQLPPPTPFSSYADPTISVIMSSPEKVLPSQEFHLKDPPHRRSEHDKWKIVPKSIYDKTV